jgi:hypothetical protein
MPLTPNKSTSEARAALAMLESYSADQLLQRCIARRATEAVVWGMPAVNFELMARAMLKAGGAWNQVVYWSRLIDWKNQTLTPNPDAIYLCPFFDTHAAGPMVMEVPPADVGSITGSIDDGWQGAIEDVGPAGVDKGKGGKYLILPPGYLDKVPAGFIALESNTFRSYALLRSNPKSGSDADVAAAVAYGKRVKVYPLAQADTPPTTRFVDAMGNVFDSTIPYDLRFFEALDAFVQKEPWLTRDKAMIDTLKSIGIEKGKAFSPTPLTRSLLEDAAAEARSWIGLKYEAVFAATYYDTGHWAVPATPAVLRGLQNDFADPNDYPVDGRGVTYAMAFFSAKHLGSGQFYLMTIQDKDGASFDGRRSYRLSVPPQPPVTLYWSATIYDRATHALIRQLPHSSRSSTTPGLLQNADGSTEIYFAPTAPDGHAPNWVPTSVQGEFEVLFRFYGPTKALFDKTWKLPDIEKLN